MTAISPSAPSPRAVSTRSGTITATDFRRAIPEVGGGLVDVAGDEGPGPAGGAIVNMPVHRADVGAVDVNADRGRLRQAVEDLIGFDRQLYER